VSKRRLSGLVIVVPLVLASGCAGKITPQQALVEEAFEMCRSQGPSAKLDRVDRDGRFSVVGRETDATRVHDCMVHYAEPTPRRPGAPPVAPVPARTPARAPQSETLVASRLPGTWRGTLKIPPRAGGEVETASPALLRFDVSAGSLRWSLAAGATAPGLAADGTAVVVDGELRMTGTVRTAGTRPPSAEPPRSSIGVRYAGTMVGDRLEVTGVTTDKQVHVLSIRRVVE
jgi:hypothetical protein